MLLILGFMNRCIDEDKINSYKEFFNKTINLYAYKENFNEISNIYNFILVY